MNIDYDIHGVLGLRLIDPTPSLARLVARQFDPWRPASLASEPDVSISRLTPPSPHERRYRLGDAGDSQECDFGESEFILRKGTMAVSIPFAFVGSGCTIGWSGAGGMRRLLIDYVRPALQIALLPKDRLALHSAAVNFGGKGILLAGWAESGKTEAMLGFLQAGAAFVSDKWTIVDGDGSSIHHFPTPITVRNWMIDLIPGLRDRLKATDLLRARAAGKPYYSAGDTAVSPDRQWLAWTEDTVGRRMSTLRIKNLHTGAILEESISGVLESVVWANDSKTIFYIRQDPQLLQSGPVYRHIVGTDPGADPMVYDEADKTLFTEVSRSASRKYILIQVGGFDTTEVLVVPADAAAWRA